MEAKVLNGGAISKEAQAAMIRKERTANNAWHKFSRNKSALVGLVIVCLMLFIGILAPVVSPYDPNALDVTATYLPPLSEGHLLGTDDLGRDLLSRLIYGARMSIVVALGATVLGGAIGILLGLISGYAGGVVDAIIMRVMDGMFAFPFILLSILLVTILGSGVFNVILAIGIGTVPGFARVVRSKVMVTKNEEFCNAERVLGASPLRIMFSHVLPNTVSEVVVYATLNIGSAIISEASLSFLGLGILIPTPSWGNILRGGRGCLTTAPHLALFSGLLIFIAVIGFNLVGDGIRDVMDPKMKK
ncbi:MAG TPA: ABC transporter permease [Candidatus Flavonifractor merdigallinarum]|uniref:ABC transporter permease n=1 Tax=Candidatus Flavonifractor merdigallinarum TaxID=2838589 RepID=A0A9D1Y9V5_9FIRM|nr:ABC transporter permease [Candidatus Flavonifractor merdigallinarum]